MASCPTEQTYGYEVSRFEKDVDENFHCSICYNVLKEPRTCRNSEHIFCLACISQHLTVNSETCPECNENLSVDTLRRPRVVNNILSKLKINCDYASRGCPEFTCLKDLETHVANCGYAPVLCSNAECSMEINKQDKVHHETEVCKYRRAKSHDCGLIQECVERLEGSLVGLDGKVETAVKKMKTNKKRVNDMNFEMNTKVEALSTQTKQELWEVRKEVNDMKDYLSKMNIDVHEVKVMMTHVLEKLNMLEQLNKLSFLAEGMINMPRQDILIAGGYVEPNDWKSSEIYSWEKNGWFEVSSMNEEHIEASSFIDKDQVFVVGGYHSKTIESLDLNELPLKWTKLPGELPYACDQHQTVVCEQSVIHIGGYDHDKRKWSSLISELQVTVHCATNELCRMPKPRECHGAEVFEGKVLILGGYNPGTITDSVLEFDLQKKECRAMPKLPFALWRMATVRWRDEVVVLGGQDRDDQALNYVFMYNSITGKITVLPSMLERRYDCCAVIAGNTIVVMGGGVEDHRILRSVECFTMGNSTWQYLPAMNHSRWRAVAEALPSGKEYV